MQRGPATDGTHHLHTGSLAVGAFHIDDFVTLAHAEVDGLLDQPVQFTHRKQRGIAHAQPAFDQIAQLQQAHSQPVAARFGSIHKTADGQVVQNAMGCGGVQPCPFADFLERDGFFTRRQNLDQGEHALDHLDAGLGGEIGVVFFHGSRPALEIAFYLVKWKCISSSACGFDPLPMFILQHFMGQKPGLVAHFRTGVDPVA